VEISKRLKTIASYVPIGSNVVADIGTDHGYIPIYLIKNNIANKCIACDINAMPLESAKQNIINHSMENQIETRLANGLSKLKIGEANVIIIAGMGGMLIINILEDNLDTVKAVGLLILQPQVDEDMVRRYLHSISFSISDEKMIYEDGKYYTIIVAKPGREARYSQEEYMIGAKLIENRDPTLKKYIEHKRGNLNKIKNNIKEIKSESSKKRLNEVEKELSIYEDVLECL